MSVSGGVDSTHEVHPILVDSNGRPYVNLNDPNPVTSGIGVIANPSGLGIFGRWNTDAAWKEIPVSFFTDTDENRGNWVVPVGNMTTEKVEGTKITDGTNTVYVWGSGAITTVKAIHYRIHESKEFLVCHRFLAVADTAEAVIHLKVHSTKSAHGYILVEADGKCFVDLYENPTTSADGTALTEYCMNRETTATPTLTAFHTPTKSADGTLLECGILGAAGHFTASGGAATGGYWLIKPSEQYLVIVTNKSGGALDIVIKYGWHEHACVV